MFREYLIHKPWHKDPIFEATSIDFQGRTVGFQGSIGKVVVFLWSCWGNMPFCSTFQVLYIAFKDVHIQHHKWFGFCSTARNESLPQLRDLFVFKGPDDGCLPLIVGPPYKMGRQKTSYKKAETTPLMSGWNNNAGKPHLYFVHLQELKLHLQPVGFPLMSFLTNLVLFCQWADKVWSATTEVYWKIGFYVHWGVSLNGGTPKMDGENNGKPYSNGWFGGTIILGNLHWSIVNRRLLLYCTSIRGH